MKSLSAVLFIVLLVAGSGCGTLRPETAVVVPATTPFDANPMARAAYIDGYESGFRAVLSGGVTAPDLVYGPHRTARQLGWRAGVAAAQREQAIQKPRSP